MDTLVAGHRRQKDGPVSEALITTEDPSGRVGIELAVFDESTMEESEGLIARSFMAIPAPLMDRIATAWKEAHPEGVAAGNYGDLETSVSEGGGTPAATFLSKQLGA